MQQPIASPRSDFELAGSNLWLSPELQKIAAQSKARARTPASPRSTASPATASLRPRKIERSLGRRRLLSVLALVLLVSSAAFSFLAWGTPRLALEATGRFASDYAAVTHARDFGLRTRASVLAAGNTSPVLATGRAELDAKRARVRSLREENVVLRERLQTVRLTLQPTLQLTLQDQEHDRYASDSSISLR